MDFLKNEFSKIVGFAAWYEARGEKMPSRYLSHTSEVQMLSNHTKLVAANPQYSDLYKAFIKTTFEKSDYAAGRVQCVCAASMEDEYAVGQAWDDYQRGIGIDVDGLDARYAQEEASLFAIYQQAYTP